MWSRAKPFASMLCIVACLAARHSLALARQPVLPDHASARQNAALIFNAVHSAGKQWASAIHHNGLSFIPAIMPRGTLLYHGRQSSTRPPGLDWLAFEVEHAEAFAYTVQLKTAQDGQDRFRGHGQKPLSMPRDSSTNVTKYLRGYLQTYRANRHLNLLYVDGMSAGKTAMGTLDAQDLVLRLNESLPDWEPGLGERARATTICHLLQDWGYDGLMRMEIGFEVMYCDFNRGIDLVAQKRSSLDLNDWTGPNISIFHWARAAAERYDGTGGDRVTLDFSSMVSCFFFPINISNSDPHRPDLHRVDSASMDELRDIRDHLRKVAVGARKFIVNWQAVADMITTRYAKRLAVMSTVNQTAELFDMELLRATRSYIDAAPDDGDVNAFEDMHHHENETADAVLACEEHYFLPAYLDRDDWTEQDNLVHTAIREVVADICGTLFRARAVMEDDEIAKHDSDGIAEAAVDTSAKRQLAQRLFADLSKRLKWAVWRRPQLCQTDEMLLTVMWPYGRDEDYWNPGCVKYDQIRQGRTGYWIPNHFEYRDPPLHADPNDAQRYAK